MQCAQACTDSTNDVSRHDPCFPSYGDEGYAKYAKAIPTQVALMTGALWGLQQVNEALQAQAVLPGGVSADDATKSLVTLFFLVVRKCRAALCLS